MKITLFTVLLASVTAPHICAASQETGKWYELVSTESDSFSLKAEPINISGTGYEGELASAIVQIRDKRSGLTEHLMWRVSGADCKRGYGRLIQQDLDGSVVARNNYVEDGENAVGQIGSLICQEYKKHDSRRLENAARCPSLLGDARQKMATAQDAGEIAEAAATLAEVEVTCEEAL